MKVRKEVWKCNSFALGKQKKFLTNIGKNQGMLIFQEKYCVFIAFHEVSSDLLMYYKEQSYREFLHQRNFVWPLYCGNTNEQSKAPQTENQLFLIIIRYLNQNSNHDFLPQTRIQSWAWQVSTKESLVVCISANCCLELPVFRKFHLRMLSLKWSSWNTWAPCQGPEWKLQLLPVDSYKRCFQIPFLGWWSIGLTWRSKICRSMLVWL